MSQYKYHDLGYNTFGPFLYGFTKWLRDRVVANEDKKIFFFSRDGYIMQKAYQLFDEKEPLGIDHNYVYFSRNSLRRGLLWNCKSFEESLQYLSKERFTDISNIASYYGLTREYLSPLLIEIGLGWEQPLLFDSLSDNEKVREVYDHCLDIIKRNSYNQYSTILSYLEQIGIRGKCAIVDIGWNGSMQYYLENIIETSETEARINGYYVGMSQSVPIKGCAEGYIFSKDNLKRRKAITCFFGVFEKFLQSLEGSTDSYKVEGGAIKPILKTYEYEKDEPVVECIKAFQKGALDYVEYALNNNISYSNVEDACAELIRFGKKPTYAETQMFRFFYNTDGEKQYFIPQKPLFKYHPKEFIYDLSNSVWKTGFMKAAFRVPFPYYLIYNLIRK